jgi:hypothetical protein
MSEESASCGVSLLVQEYPAPPLHVTVESGAHVLPVPADALAVQAAIAATPSTREAPKR